MAHGADFGATGRGWKASKGQKRDSGAAFRREHLKAPAKLFAEVLALCWKAGWGKVGQVAIDGTKIEANAGKHRRVVSGGWSGRTRKKTAATGRGGAGRNCRSRRWQRLATEEGLRQYLQRQASVEPVFG